MKRTLIVSALALTLTAGLSGVAQAAPGDSRVTANGTYRIVDVNGNYGPVQHGRRTYTMGSGEGVEMTSGSCKTVDADGTRWGPYWVTGAATTCYGSSGDV